MTPWQALDVSQDIAVADLRRRYAALIKAFRPETHPQDFARIREAYEVALPYARQREFEAAQQAQQDSGDVAVEADVEADTDNAAIDEAPTEAAVDVATPLEIVDTVPLSIEEEIAVADDAIGSMPIADAAAPTQDEPTLAEHFRRFHALAEAAVGTRDEALLPELHSLLQARSQASLDDSQALEFALMRWFIEAEMPPLTLLFEAGRAFDWHAHVTRLSNWLSPWALRQMEARLSLSRDLVYARHFSGNAWLRRLHAPRAGFVPIAFRPAALEAQHWAERWRHASEDADAKSLADCLDARTLKRLGGFMSTDLLVGLAAAAMGSDALGAGVIGVVVTGLVFLARKGLQAIVGLPPKHGVRRFARAVTGNRMVVGVMSAIAGAIGVALMAGTSPKPGEIAAGAVLVIPALMFAAALAWRIAAYVELMVAWPFLWREAVDRLEFDRFLNSRVAPADGRLFGARLGFVERLKAIKLALQFQEKEIAQRARPPRAKPFKLFRFTGVGGKPSLGRMLWFGAWVLFAILRLVHAIGGS